MGDVSFKNVVIRALLRRMSTAIEGTNFSPIGQAVLIIYNGTSTNSKAQQLLVDNLVRRGNAQWIDQDHEENHPEFLLDLALAFFRYCAEPDASGRSWELQQMMEGKYEEL